jgi:endonuclease III
VGNPTSSECNVGSREGTLAGYGSSVHRKPETLMGWVPPKYGLVQEKYWPDGWKILVCCLCLNLPTRKQMESVVEEMFKRWPTAASLSQANEEELQELITENIAFIHEGLLPDNTIIAAEKLLSDIDQPSR